MIYPNKKKLHYQLMTWYSQRILAKDFHEIKIIGDFVDDGKSLLVLGNHSTWWDGFWMLYLNNKLLEKNFYIVMLEVELKKRLFFSKVGAYSIQADANSIKESLHFTKNLLDKPGNMVVFYPEGKFSSASQLQKEFQRGISFFYKNEPVFTTLFVVCLTDYFAERKPTLYMYFKQNNYQKGTSQKTIETDYNLFFQQSVDKQKMAAV